MRCRFALLLVLLLIPVLAFGQGGQIGIFVDSYSTDCDIADYPGYISIYVYHLWSLGATSSRFRVIQDYGAHFTHFAEQSPLGTPLTGNSQTGVTVSYGACLASPVHILTIVYRSYGLSADCSYLFVVADSTATSGRIEVTDCADPPNILYDAWGSCVIINPVPDVCDECGTACPPPSPVGEATWGRIKALFRR